MGSNNIFADYIVGKNDIGAPNIQNIFNAQTFIIQYCFHSDFGLNFGTFSSLVEIIELRKG